MVVTLDIGVVTNIHPPYKIEVGNRLASWALAKDHSLNIPYSGPVFKTLKKENNSLIVGFDFAKEGLVTKGKSLNEFEIAGDDRKFYPATAQIRNNEVILSSRDVLHPQSVRYCWRNGAEASLFNKSGLPANLFHATLKP